MIGSLRPTHLLLHPCAKSTYARNCLFFFRVPQKLMHFARSCILDPLPQQILRFNLLMMLDRFTERCWFILGLLSAACARPQYIQRE